MQALLSKWMNLPAAYRPIPFWSWNDELEPERLREQIRWMHKSGIGGFFMHARGGLKTPYLGEQWMQCIEVCCDEAKNLGMDAWAYDENGWPSGFAGGLLLEDMQNRDMYLTQTRGKFDHDADISYKIGEATLIRATADEGGEYLNIYMHRSASTVDILNPAVVRKFLDVTHEAYKKRLGSAFSADLKGFFTDEPQYYRADTPYTPMLESYFREEYGEDILDGLGLLFLEKEGYRTFRYRYWLAMQKLMLDSFAKQLYTWCCDNGIAFTGHYVEEVSMGAQLMCCAGTMPFYEYETIPGIDWLGKDTDNELSPRQLGSAARQLGKKQTLTETFGCCGWNVTPAELHRIAGFQYACGANLMCHHLIPYSEHGQRKRDYPAHFNPINPWIDTHFKDFNDYFARLGYLLAESEEPVNVAMLHPMRSAYFDYKRGTVDIPESWLDPSQRHACRTLSCRGIGYHFLDETLLEKYGFVDGDAIGCGQCRYTYLVLPKILTMGRHTEMLLRKFVENGGKILLLDDKPGYLEGEKFDYTYLSSNVSLADIIAAQPFSVENTDTALYCTYRIFEGKQYLFVQNASGEKSFTQTFRFAEGGSFIAIDPVTMQTKKLPLTVTLDKNESLLLQVSPDAAPEATEKPVFTLRFHGAKAKFDQNFLTLDTLQWSEDGVNYSRPMLCNELNALLLRRRYEGKLWLRYSFELQEIPEKMHIIAEKSDAQHLLNGHEITFSHTLEEDHCFRAADISAYLQKGANHYETVMHWHQSEATYYALFGEGVTESLRNCIAYDSEIEAVYLAGHFGVYAHNAWEKHDEKHLLGSKFYIGKAPETVCETVTDGLPFFRGELTLTQTVDLPDPNIRLALEGDFLTAKIAVNGQFASEICFENAVDISRFAKPGENEISVTFMLGNRNLLGPFHAAGAESFVCPTLFETSDIPATENGDPRYKFRTFYQKEGTICSVF
ncbi:MAG: hypothetical protein IJN60_06455 [Oscillospiraceae bacterium]|nr:hypothetical protein [Oscillospiraceae bacterium]